MVNIVQRQISKQKYICDADTNIYIITWRKVVNFFANHIRDNAEHLTADHCPLPLRMHIIETRGTILWTDGELFQILESFDDELKEYTMDALNAPIDELLKWIENNYTRLNDFYKSR